MPINFQHKLTPNVVGCVPVHYKGLLPMGVGGGGGELCNNTDITTSVKVQIIHVY